MNVANDKQIIESFVKEIEAINPNEFFSFDDLFKVKEVMDETEYLIRMESDHIGYDLIPKKGYRYVYYGMLAEITQQMPLVSFLELKAAFEKLGYVMEADEQLAFIGLPESHFEVPYTSKFENGIEG